METEKDKEKRLKKEEAEKNKAIEKEKKEALKKVLTKPRQVGYFFGRLGFHMD